MTKTRTTNSRKAVEEAEVQNAPQAPATLADELAELEASNQEEENDGLPTNEELQELLAEVAAENSFDDTKIIEDLIKSGRAYRINGYKIKKVHAHLANPDDTNATCLYYYNITLDKFIWDMVQDPETLVWSRQKTKVLHNISAINLGYAMRSNKTTRLYENVVLQKPQQAELMLVGCEISFLQEKVVGGQDYISPFSTDKTVRKVKHDDYYNHIISVKFDAENEQIANKKKETIFDLF